MITTALFDLDGTLLDTEPDFTLILNRLLARHDLAPVSRERVRATVSSGARALIKLGFDIDEQDPAFAGLLEEFLGLYEVQIHDTHCLLFPGMERLLARLCEAGLGWGIVTNKPSRFTVPLLKQVPGLADCGIVICPDHVKLSKPDPEGLLLACARAGGQPPSCVYVGDHPRDIEAGRGAGMRTIAAAWGYLPEDSDIHDWQADLVARDAGDIERFIFKEAEPTHV